MDLMRMASVRVTVPNKKPEGRLTEPIGFVRLEVLNDLGQGRLYLGQVETALLERRPNEQLIRRLIALRHQCRADLEEIGKRLETLKMDASTAHTIMTDYETRISRIQDEGKKARRQLACSLENEQKAIENTLQAVSDMMQEWEAVVAEGNKKYLIQSTLKLAAKAVLRSITKKFMARLNELDPVCYSTRSNPVGRFIVESISSARHHHDWEASVAMQTVQMDFATLTLKEKVLSADARLPFDERKMQLIKLSGALQEAMGYIAVARDSADRHITRVRECKNVSKTNLSRLGRYTKKPSQISAYESVRREQEVEERLYNSLEKTFGLSKAVLLAVSEEMSGRQKLISSYIQSMEQLNRLKGKEEEMRAALAEARKAKAEASANAWNLEEEKRAVSEMLKLAEDEYSERKRQILHDNGKTPTRASCADTECMQMTDGCIASFVAKTRLLYPQIEATYPSMSGEFDRALRALALFYIEKNGVMTSMGLERNFTKRARDEDLLGLDSQYKIVRFGIGKRNFFRFMIDCTDAVKPWIIFFGTKENSDWFIRNGNFVGERERMASKGQNPFELLRPVMKAD